MESPKALEMHVCIIQEVHESGLVDALSHRQDVFFRKIVTTNAELADLEPGRLCIVLTDGAQHYLMGTLRWPQTDEFGKVSIKDPDDDLADLPGSKSLTVNDKNGNQVRVVVSRGGGIIMDTGGINMIHLSPNGKKEYFKEYECVSPGMYKRIEQDATEIVLRNTVDTEAIERDLTLDRDLSLDKGHTLQVRFVNEEDEVLSLTQRKDGEVQWKLSVDPDGQLDLYHSQELEHEDDHPALAKMVHRMVVAAVDNIMSQTLTSDFGRPMTLVADPVASSANALSRTSLSNEFTNSGDNTVDTDREDDTSLSFSKLRFRQLEVEE